MGNGPSPESQLMFRDIICCNAQRQVILNRPKFKHKTYASSAYLQAFKRFELKWPRKPRETILSYPQGQPIP